MNSEMDTVQLKNIKKIHRVLAIFLCFIMLLSLCVSAFISFVNASDNTRQAETQEEIKARLMRQIKYEGWDPYSENMTVEEFFALMELFDEGKLPLNQVSTYSLINSMAADEDSYIPRTKFLFAGLGGYVPAEGMEDSAPLEYNNNTGAPNEPSAYPPGLDPFGSGYKRPPMGWKGIKLDDPKTKRVLIVSKGVNSDNMAVAGDVVQSLFEYYNGYYVKQVTLDGANASVLGMINVEGKYIYYYLSAEDQNTQVSTTTLPDEAKLIVEYVPEEHIVDYVVRFEGSEVPVTNDIPEDVVMFGSNSPTEVSWADSIFGASRPHKTTDGAYSFDVFVPYGYELQIFISIEMSVTVPYESNPNAKDSFHVEIDHTSKKDQVRADWLEAYSTYLQDEGFIDDKNKALDYIIRTEDSETGHITLEWKDSEDPDKPAHDSILSRIAERINDFIVHNNGYPLGMYPDYSIQGPGGFRLLADTTKGPTEHTMNDTFYNHLVKADRTVTAVLKKQENPTFDVSQILQKSDGAKGRGSSADKDFAFDSIEKYDEDYAYHAGGGTLNGTDDPLSGHGSVYPNVKSGDGWRWTNDTNGFRSSAQDMKYDAATGTYYYTWLFQTNDGDGGYYLDAFEVNGIPITIPFYPKYNWQGSYIFQGNVEVADDRHPYYTETTLADGSILKLEFLLGWNSGTLQRHYRVTVTGARSNVVVTGFNLMTGNGAPEFVTYNLVGVYSNEGGYSQTAPAIEYYAQTGVWTRKAQANVIVDSDGLGIDYNGGDATKYGANLRFKITEGYGNPYYSWTNRHGDVINGQASATFDEDGNVTSTNDIISLKAANTLVSGEAGALIDGTLSSQYIYDGGDGYYYIRVTNQRNTTGDNYRFALLTVVARTIKYTVRYTPEYDPNVDSMQPWQGFVIDPDTEKLVPLTQDWVGSNREALNLDHDSMPSFAHDPNICALWGMAKDETGEVPPIYQDILYQYDDNEGPFYDLIFNNMATIANDAYGTIRPKDRNNRYIFTNWILVGENFMPVRDEENNYIQFLGGAIDVVKYASYSVKHVAFGDDSTDIHVFRLMPVWSYIAEPLVYSVVLNWVDSLGIVHAEEFHDNWDDVITEMTDEGRVFVYINKDARPFLDWISNHPTYTFWDEVNNATTENEIEEALTAYLKRGGVETDPNDYQNILSALKDETNFERHGSDIFIVKNEGKISIWMYENKGGLVFHKDVQDEPFIPNDEFYFTIVNAKVGENFNTPLTGVYKAYPQFVYDADGNRRDRTDADSWIVEFKNGEIVSIDGNKNVTYFTLKSGEGIDLYVSAGQYTIVELGSKSGGDYKVKVTYTASDGSASPDENWRIPDEENLWLSGREKKYHEDFLAEVRQVAATVDFAVGEHNVVQTLTFCNQTASLSVEKRLDANAVNFGKLQTYRNREFLFSVDLKLPAGYSPLKYIPLDDDGNEMTEGIYYYFQMNVYNVSDGSVVRTENLRLIAGKREENGSEIDVWSGSIALKAGQRAAIVMTVPYSGGEINYWVEEVNTPAEFTEHWTGKSGVAEAGKRSEAIVVNWYGDDPEPPEPPEPPETEYGYLVITETGGKSNESFIYRVTSSNGDSIIVTVKGGGKAYVYAPLGEYTVEEISDWSWWYDEGECKQSTSNPKDKTCTVEITDKNTTIETAVHADYTHKRNDKVWPGGETSEDNRFAEPSTTDEEQGADSRKTEYALPAVAYDVGNKKHDEGDDQ